LRIAPLRCLLGPTRSPSRPGGSTKVIKVLGLGLCPPPSLSAMGERDG